MLKPRTSIFSSRGRFKFRNFQREGRVYISKCVESYKVIRRPNLIRYSTEVKLYKCLAEAVKHGRSVAIVFHFIAWRSEGRVLVHV